ncbi:NAD(P)-dependent oxidoreductase [Bengtsoniella intestinalis]|uniref:NAD(P)-dependent oxidoreductase n=1 Tax=Bengtsoniella intestinalis TaxID=3073143 RepID=UPI00391FBECB
MKVVMSGLDYSLAPIELREQLSFTKECVAELDAKMTMHPGVCGCVLLSTCNRTELYISLLDGAEVAPDALLCQVAGVDHAPFAHAFVSRHKEEAVTHLMEVACGLKSQIWGEDQILSQVKTAVEIARDADATDGILETVFRTAISAGKAVKHKVRLTGIPTSAAHGGVLALERAMGDLTGKRAMVVGNGEMGRLAAGLLRDKGCIVTVTLRTYRHGETIIPAGCAVSPYEERYTTMDTMDIVVSATTSPHHTISCDDYQAVPHPPKYLVDLAVPRDIDGAIGCLAGVTLFHVDNMGVSVGKQADTKALEEVQSILDEHRDRLRHWWYYRNSIQENAHPRFPLFIDLWEKPVVVVGGGAIACRRIDTLLKFGANITVIAPHWEHKMIGVTWLARPYELGDLDGAILAVAATDNRSVNAEVGKEAKILNIPVSVADNASACSFYFPAVCMDDTVVAGLVSCDGAHHSHTAKAAKAIRKTLEELS